jgi:probable HAF family extracellular repeat protein
VGCQAENPESEKIYMQSRIIVVVASLTVAWSSLAVAAPVFTPLGDLPGGLVSSNANDVSDDAGTVVGQGNSASGDEAFVWTSGGGMVGLGDLAGVPFLSQAFAVSADGLTVVGQGNSASGEEAFVWTSGGSMLGIGDLAGGADFPSMASAVSGDGSVVVGHGQSAAGTEAFIWTSGGGMLGLGDLVGGGFSSQASGISDDGLVIAGAGESASGVEAFIWTSGGGLMGIGSLPGGGFYSYGNGLSADGTTVVGQSFSSSGFEAFMWSSAGGMVALGDLPGGTSFQSAAFAVSDSGATVVGSSSGTLNSAEAFVWTTNSGMQRVLDVALAQGVTGLTGWTLRNAYGISPDASTIVGDAINPAGQTEAWIITGLEMPNGLLGDINGDGVVNVQDLLLMQQALQGQVTLVGAQKWRADLYPPGGNQALDVSDWHALQSLVFQP